MSKIKIKRTYKRYTDEFKRDAVRLVEREGLSAAQVARDLGMHVGSLHDWLRKSKDAAFSMRVKKTSFGASARRTGCSGRSAKS